MYGCIYVVLPYMTELTWGTHVNVILFDVLFRFFREIYGDNNVKYVRNFTDIDDKINQRD